MVTALQKMIERHAAVEKAQKPLTVHLSPNNVFVALDIQLRPDLSASDVAAIIAELKTKIHQEHETVGRIFIEVEKYPEKEQ
jgi:divalent metal cation (Fe/Co/Zn/Cd) transporter